MFDNLISNPEMVVRHHTWLMKTGVFLIFFSSLGKG